MKPPTLEADGKVLPSNTTLQPRGAANLSHADAWSLPIEMRKRVKGEVRFDDGSRALYATDGSNYRQTPIGVVLPQEQGRRHRRDRGGAAVWRADHRRAGAGPVSRGSAATWR